MTEQNPYKPPEASVADVDEVAAIEAIAQPWLSIWTRPRATIRYLVATDPEKWVLPLAALSGISNALDELTDVKITQAMDLSSIIVAGIVGGLLGGIIGLYVLAFLIRITGRWLGGNASSRDLRAVIAWASVPTVVALLAWVFAIVVIGKDLFVGDADIPDDFRSIANYLVFGLCVLVLGIWSVVLHIVCLAEVQHFSKWRAVGNYVLAVLMLAVPIGLIAAAVGLL